MWLRQLAHELLGVVVPPACVACRVGLTAAGEVLCAECRRALPWLADPLCRRCSLPRPCRPCPAASASWDAAWAPLAYEASARAVVGALKFGGALAVADAMAACIAANAPHALVEERALVPVPLHPARQRARGFNQAQRLALALSSRCGCEVSACLRRRGAATRQLGSGRRARMAPGRLRYEAIRAPPVRATLIDDVHTTGATLEACSRALRAAGTRSVCCLTYARTLR